MVRSSPDTKVKKFLCNLSTYKAGDPFATSLAYVLDELKFATPDHENYDFILFFDIYPNPNAFAYGHDSCDQDLTSSDCSECFSAAKKVTVRSCPNRIGAQVVLLDCEIRYEQYPFSN
ncbi:hypothetical protein L484_025055 [Morus notabilis]|uniref:Gnk2-homologous domain-containing protein n=1 Tax=Morus notabilis TaxID=981085 RepID=W9QKR5_9ROSA|nr:antifungal protein ginkbilobin-2 [Morus notabilis]EXB39360.1 hypothetical protein L484_025055 [Morus notabilis]